MIRLAWDASALAKRYAAELGSHTVNALFAVIPLNRMLTTTLGYAETISVLTRKRNRGSLSGPLYTAALSVMDREILFSGQFTVLDVDRATVFAGIPLIRTRNIGATDSAVLAAFLAEADSARNDGDTLLLISSDRRLLRAAAAEGLGTLNPESVTPADLTAILT